MVQTKPRTRAQRIEAAVDHALHGRWDLAAQANRALMAERPDDLEAANRLGKALTELGDLGGAADAYRRSLEIDRFNAIARKNLDRIEAATSKGGSKGASKASKGSAKRASGAGGSAPRVTSTASLIEESGKSATLKLARPEQKALARAESGDTVELRAGPRGVTVHAESGALLGSLEPHAGSRLARLIDGGNHYEGVLRSVTETGALVHVRETYRHPSLLDQASFLAPAQERRKNAPRAYTRSSVVGRESLRMRDDEDEPDPWANDDDDSDLERAGFSDASDDDLDEDDDAVAADMADEDLGGDDGDEDPDEDES